MAAFLDNCRFVPTAGGTTDWTFSSAVVGSQSPSAAGVVNGTKYKYNAISADLTQWEIGEGAYNTGTGVLPRTTVLYNSSGTGTATGQSGAGTKINFTLAPNVAIIGIKEDLISIEEANSFTTTQQLQARTNILAAWRSENWTRTVKTSSSGTYTTPTNCKAILVKLVGGGAGGDGSGTSPGAATAGGNSTFGSSLLTANGGGISGSGAAAASGGDINFNGAQGQGQSASTNVGGGMGGASFFGGAGLGGTNGNSSRAAVTNSGSGGGGGASTGTANAGGGGNAGAYCEKLIVSPSATYSYAVGAAGNAGTAGTGGAAGGGGGSGIIIIEEYY